MGCPVLRLRMPLARFRSEGPSYQAPALTHKRQRLEPNRISARRPAEQRVRKRRDRPDPLGGEADARGRRVGKARTNPRPASTIWQG